MDRWTKEDVNHAVRVIDQRGAVDSDFRKLAVHDPDEAIRQETGRDAPSGCRLKIIEHAPEFNLPNPLPDCGRVERFRAELDEVAKKLFP